MNECCLLPARDRLLAMIRGCVVPAATQRGQALVEFALVTATLLLFLVGTLDIGRAIFYYNVLSNAARDGARYASVTDGTAWSAAGNTPGTYTTTVPYAGSTTIVGATAKRTAGLDPGGVQVLISAPMGTSSGMDLPVAVSTQYVYHPTATTLLGIGPITITAQSTMRIN